MSGFARFVPAVLVAAAVAVTAAAQPEPKDKGDGLKEVAKGVQARDLKVGTGDECPPGATVTVHYTGWLTDGTKFDSSRDRGKAATFELDAVISGWQDGIPGMKTGGVRKLVIAPEKGYGVRGNPPKIPANAALVFEVELIRFTGGAVKARPRRDPVPKDLSKLSDGTPPTADDPKLTPVGKAGLMVRDLKVGDGPVVKAGQTVVVDYVGWLKTNGKLFDSSFKGPRPFETKLEHVIPGWQQGVPGMKVGGIRKLVIPAELAYGERGAGADIPPNATLVFEVEVLGAR